MFLTDLFSVLPCGSLTDGVARAFLVAAALVSPYPAYLAARSHPRAVLKVLSAVTLLASLAAWRTGLVATPGVGSALSWAVGGVAIAATTTFVLSVMDSDGGRARVVRTPLAAAVITLALASAAVLSAGATTLAANTSLDGQTLWADGTGLYAVVQHGASPADRVLVARADDDTRVPSSVMLENAGGGATPFMVGRSARYVAVRGRAYYLLDTRDAGTYVRTSADPPHLTVQDVPGEDRTTCYGDVCRVTKS